MKKLYIDRTEIKECIGVFVKDAEVFSAGTTMNVMSVKQRTAEYDRFAEQYGIFFLFADDIPVIERYAIPQLDIFATDGCNGLFGTVGEETSDTSAAPICYIDINENCYLVADNFREFVRNAAVWRERLVPYEGLTFYASKADAEKELEFITPYEMI